MRIFLEIGLVENFAKLGKKQIPILRGKLLNYVFLNKSNLQKRTKKNLKMEIHILRGETKNISKQKKTKKSVRGFLRKSIF